MEFISFERFFQEFSHFSKIDRKELFWLDVFKLFIFRTRKMGFVVSINSSRIILLQKVKIYFKERLIFAQTNKDGVG